jgi:hypothetical protein
MIAAGMVISGCSPSKEQAMRGGEEASRPAIAALQQYHERHGHYPARLEELVADGLIDSIPSIPEVQGMKKSGLRYQMDLDTDFYRLGFSYDIPGSSGPGAIYQHIYLSDTMEWLGGKYPPTMASEVAKRAGRRYRETGSSKYLTLFFEKEIQEASCSGKCINLWKTHVLERLGEGKEVNIDGQAGILYEGRDATAERFFVVYRSKVFPGIPGEFEVVAKIYTTRTADNRWQLKVTGE